MNHDMHDHAGHGMPMLPPEEERGAGSGMSMDTGGPGAAMEHYHGPHAPPQGGMMDLLEFVVMDSAPVRSPALPDRLTDPPSIATRSDTPRREFLFDSGAHQVNGRTFGLERIDVRIPLGQTEIWSFVNGGGESVPFPIHVHGTQFQVLSRTGGRNQVMPWESGLKDTVLLEPGERVEVAIRFDRHTGMFAVEPSNAELRDRGTMFNVLVEG